MVDNWIESSCLSGRSCCFVFLDLGFLWGGGKGVELGC